MKTSSWVAILGLVTVSGCVTWIPCESSADCPGGGVCDETRKICAAPPVGVDAGPTILCAQGCPDWTVCHPDNPAGTCKPVSITPVQPQHELHSGGQRAKFEFVVTDGEGGVYPGETIPVMAMTGGVTGPDKLKKSDSGVFGETFDLANVAGQQSVKVGWDAVNATIVVDTEQCDVTCAEWQECRPTKDGGVCETLDVKLSVAEPDGATVGMNSAVPIRANVWRTDGGALPKRVPFRTTTGVKGFLAYDASFGATIDGGDQGPVEVVLGWEDGGPYVKGSYFVDTTPPTLALVVASDGGAYQRDAIIPAIVTSEEAVTDAGLSLGGIAMARTATSNCPNYGGTSHAAACFLLDFSEPALRALDGGFDVVLSGTDVYGNSGPTAGPTLPVTRVRWTVAPTAQQVQALTVGPDGTLFVGTAVGTTTTGSIAKVDPANGVASFFGQNAAVQALATANGVLYYSANDHTTDKGSIGATDTATLSTTSQQDPCRGVPGSRTYSGIALYKAAGDVIRAVGSINGSTYGCVYDPTGVVDAFHGTTNQFDAPGVPNKVDTATNIVISTSTLTASLLHQDVSGDPSAGAWWQPVTLTASGISPTTGSPLKLGSDTYTVPVGQALLAGSVLVGAGGAIDDAKIFTIDNGSLDGGSLGGTAGKGVPAIASAAEGYVGTGATLVRFNPSDLSATATLLQTLSGTGGVIRTSPILGAARPVGGGAEGYAVSNGGTLVVFSQGLSTDTWTAPLAFGAGSSVVTHPTMDCNRATLSRNTGVLYVGDDKGAVKAIVVDSPRLLDSPGAWPKYQRSAGNAGNDDTTNFPTNWGGCP